MTKLIIGASLSISAPSFPLWVVVPPLHLMRLAHLHLLEVVLLHRLALHLLNDGHLQATTVHCLPVEVTEPGVVFDLPGTIHSQPLGGVRPK